MSKIDSSLKERVYHLGNFSRSFMATYEGIIEEPLFDFMIEHFQSFTILHVDILNRGKEGKNYFMVRVHDNRQHPTPYFLIIDDFLYNMFCDDEHKNISSHQHHKQYKQLTEEEYNNILFS